MVLTRRAAREAAEQSVIAELPNGASAADADRGQRTRTLELPYGRSIAPQMMAMDPAPKHIQALYLAGTVLGLGALPCLPAALPYLFPGHLATNWDQDNGLDWRQWQSSAPLLLEKALSVSPPQMGLAAAVTLAATLLLATADLLSSVLPNYICWPTGWETSNCQCYTEMFCEPTRASLVRRPGNTYSNIVYLFTSVLILISVGNEATGSNLFWLPDALFAAMLAVLGVLSVIWHASNAPKAQYIDLWSMESCIAFLILRICCLGSGVLLAGLHGVIGLTPWAVVFQAAPMVCTAAFLAAVITNGQVWLGRLRRGWLDAGCPFSGRARLEKQSQGGASEDHWPPIGHLYTRDACLYAGLPLIYMILPVAVQLFALRSLGSYAASTAAAASLVVGWSLRMFERFCLDGWAPMNAVIALQRLQDSAARPFSLKWAAHHVTAPLLTAAAAVLSPTAILHTMTGITLLAGYVHARTLDDEVAQQLSATAAGQA